MLIHLDIIRNIAKLTIIQTQTPWHHGQATCLLFAVPLAMGFRRIPLLYYIYIHILSHALVMKSLEISPYIPLNPVKSNYCHHYIYMYIYIYTTYIPIGWRTRGSFIFENGHKPWRLDENHHGSNVGFT